MDRAKAIIIQKEIDAALQIIFKKHGLRQTKNNVSFTTNEFNMSVKTISAIPIIVSNPMGDKLAIENGMAVPGTIAYVRDANDIRKFRQIRIMQSRRVKYAIEFTDEPGKMFLTRFGNVISEIPKI